MGSEELSSSATSELRSSCNNNKNNDNINSNYRVWTNERHVDYLNSMEAFFVRSMLDNNNNTSLSLNRNLLDISDSTLHRRTPPAATYPISDILVRSDKRRRRRLPSYSRPYKTPSPDQVVPQYDNRRANDNSGEEKDHQLQVAPQN